ncbi:MAG: hypothetical protein ABR588_08980 [Sphingomicrobium sp.]|nr:hypothetical protein [Sphingomonadales bacterium]
MRTPTTHAGGLFLMLAILIGSLWGVIVGAPMLGVLRGTGIGILIAIAVWLIDRRRVSGDASRRPDHPSDTVDRV